MPKPKGRHVERFAGGDRIVITNLVKPVQHRRNGKDKWDIEFVVPPGRVLMIRESKDYVPPAKKGSNPLRRR